MDQEITINLLEANREMPDKEEILSRFKEDFELRLLERLESEEPADSVREGTDERHYGESAGFGGPAELEVREEEEPAAGEPAEEAGPEEADESFEAAGEPAEEPGTEEADESFEAAGEPAEEAGPEEADESFEAAEEDVDDGTKKKKKRGRRRKKK